MAMRPHEFTVHGLSIEFGMHKETVAQKIRTVEPRRIEGGRRLYFISDVAKYLVGSAAAEGEPDRARAEARRAEAEAELAELKLGERKSELVSVADFAAELERAFTAVRARLLAIPPKLAPILAPDNPARARTLLDAAVLEALSELEHTDEFDDEPGGEEEAPADG